MSITIKPTLTHFHNTAYDAFSYIAGICSDIRQFPNLLVVLVNDEQQSLSFLQLICEALNDRHVGLGRVSSAKH